MIRRWILPMSLLWLGILGLLTAPAAADDTERIASYRMHYEVHANGTVHVVERLSYEFGPYAKHGIERLIQTTEPYDDDDDRRYRLDNITVSSPTGAPSTTDITEANGMTTIRIGDPDRTVNGTQEYVLRYDLGGALNHVDGTAELYWNAAGPDWQVPIDDLEITAAAPTKVTKSRCLVGNPGDKTECPTRIENGKATFRVDRLEPGQVMTIVAAMPAGQVDADAPILEPSNPILRAFQVDSTTLTQSATVLGVGAIPMLIVLVRRGVIAVRNRPPTAGMSWTATSPPTDISPAEAGVIVRGKPSTEDMIATMFDLAVRGYIQINDGELGRTIAKRQGPDRTLRPHETAFLATVFQYTNEVSFSKLSNAARDSAKAVDRSLRTTAFRRGWFHSMRTPKSVVSTIVGMVWFLTVPLVGFIAWELLSDRQGILALATVAAAVLALLAINLATSNRRTLAGKCVNRQLTRFRRSLEQTRTNALKATDNGDVLGRYLPWTTAFGLEMRTKVWCDELQESSRLPASVPWFNGTDRHAYAAALVMSEGLSALGATSEIMDGGDFSGGGGAESIGGMGSGFGGGGFAGGGGSGGGGGSW